MIFNSKNHKNKMKCRECGNELLSTNSAFCSSCGAQIIKSLNKENQPTEIITDLSQLYKDYSDTQNNAINIQISSKRYVPEQNKRTGEAFVHKFKALYSKEIILSIVKNPVFIFAMIYLISPIDILPDAIPVAGTFDDLFAIISGVSAILNAQNNE